VDLVCPECHSPLTSGPDGGRRCTACPATYPKRAGIDVFLSDHEWRECRAHLDEEREILREYEAVRRTVPATVAYYDWWVGELFKEIPASAQGLLVELMCGGAEISRRLPARFSEGFALDLNVDSVELASNELAKKGERRVTLVGGTAAKVPLADQCTDVVIIQGALHHARPIINSILTEVKRLLRPGGTFIGSEPANDHWLTRAIRHWQYRHSRLQGHDPDEDGFSEPELAAALSTNGLQMQEYRQFGFIAYPLLGNTDILPYLTGERSRWLWGPLMSVDRVLEQVPLIRKMAWASLFRAVKN